jgi:hypothetical protein
MCWAVRSQAWLRWRGLVGGDRLDKPTSIKIGYIDYTVTWVDNKWSDSTGRRGEIDYCGREIFIVQDMDNLSIADTFIHELMHALMQHYERNIETPIERERAVEIMGAGLVMVWRDNPDVLKWWSSLICG